MQAKMHLTWDLYFSSLLYEMHINKGEAEIQ